MERSQVHRDRDMKTMNCSDVVDVPEYTRLLKRMYALKRNGVANGITKKWKARFVVCENKDVYYEKVISPVADYNTVKLIICLAL